MGKLASVVLANNEETVLLPMNKPIFGTRRRWVLAWIYLSLILSHSLNLEEGMVEKYKKKMGSFEL